MTELNTYLDLCSRDRTAFDSAMEAGNYPLAEEKAQNLFACAIGLDNEALQKDALNLQLLAQNKANAKATSSPYLPIELKVTNNLKDAWTQIFGPQTTWPTELRSALNGIDNARGKSGFEHAFSNAMLQLALSPATLDACFVGIEVLRSFGGKYSAAATAVEKSLSGGILSARTASFAYNTLFGAPEDLLLPLLVTGKVGKVFEGVIALGSEALGLSRTATVALRAAGSLPAKATAFVTTSNGVQYAKDRPVDLSLAALAKESFGALTAFGIIEGFGWLGGVFGRYIAPTETGVAAAYWTQTGFVISGLMAVDVRNQLTSEAQVEDKSFIDMLAEATIFHFAAAAMMGSLALDNVGVEFQRARAEVSNIIDLLTNAIFPKWSHATANGQKTGAATWPNSIFATEGSETTGISQNSPLKAEGDPFLKGRTRFSFGEWATMTTEIIGPHSQPMRTNARAADPRYSNSEVWEIIVGDRTYLYVYCIGRPNNYVEIIASSPNYSLQVDAKYVHVFDPKRIIDSTNMDDNAATATILYRGGKIVDLNANGNCMSWLARLLDLKMETQGLSPDTPTENMFVNALMKITKPVEPNNIQVGDVVLYGNENKAYDSNLQVKHVGIVSRIDDNGTVYVMAKLGGLPVFEMPLDVTFTNYGNKAIFLRINPDKQKPVMPQAPELTPEGCDIATDLTEIDLANAMFYLEMNKGNVPPEEVSAYMWVMARKYGYNAANDTAARQFWDAAALANGYASIEAWLDRANQ